MIMTIALSRAYDSLEAAGLWLIDEPAGKASIPSRYGMPWPSAAQCSMLAPSCNTRHASLCGALPASGAITATMPSTISSRGPGAGAGTNSCSSEEQVIRFH